MTETHRPKNRIEFLQIIERMYERKYENVNIRMSHDGLDVEYDLIEAEPEDPKLAEQLLKVCMGSEIPDTNRKHQACFIPYPDFLLEDLKVSRAGSKENEDGIVSRIE